MGIFKDFFRTVKDKKVVKEEEKFKKLNDVDKQIVCDKVLEHRGDEKTMAGIIEKEPYVLPYVIADLKGKDVKVLPLVDIALSKGISIYDLIDKNVEVSNAQILNFAVANHPEVLAEIEDKPQYANLLTTDTIIEAFKKNPFVIYSDCDVLDTPLTLRRQIVVKKDENGKEMYVGEYNADEALNEGEYQKIVTRETTVLKVLQRALNLYFRPEAYSEKQFDGYAMEIASQIKSDSFVEKVEDNKMTTRVITAANETLKRNPEKGRVVPGSVLHMHKNRVMYVIPNQAKKNVNKSQENYKNYRKYMHGLLENSALKLSQTEEKVRIVKRSVSIVPELFFDLKKDEAYRDVLNKLTVQLSAFEAFKNQDKNKDASTLLTLVGAENEKKILSRAKANKTRKANKNKKAQAKNAEAEKEIVEEKVL